MDHTQHKHKILFSGHSKAKVTQQRCTKIKAFGLPPFQRQRNSLASSPGHSQLFNVARRKTGEPGSRSHVRVIYVEGWWKGDYFAWVLPLLAHSNNWFCKLAHGSFCWTNTTRTPVSRAGNRIRRQTDSLMVPSGRFVHYKPYGPNFCA